MTKEAYLFLEEVMMMNILIINGSAKFGLISKAELNLQLTQFAKTFLEAKGNNVKITQVENGYDPEDEVNKYLWADIIIYQMPGWWMGLPWIFKKYIDDVFSAGHGKLYESDGRTRKDMSKKYGSAGLSQDKKYMLSVTWNAPLQAFIGADEFFEGAGADGVYYAFHKANQFLGMQALETFMINDVIKNTDLPRYLKEYDLHLNKVFA